MVYMLESRHYSHLQANIHSRSAQFSSKIRLTNVLDLKPRDKYFTVDASRKSPNCAKRKKIMWSKRIFWSLRPIEPFSDLESRSIIESEVSAQGDAKSVQAPPYPSADAVVGDLLAESVEAEPPSLPNSTIIN